MAESSASEWGAATVLGVGDVRKAVDWYGKVLGFECQAVFEPPDHEPVYGIVSRPGVQLHLQIRHRDRGERDQGDCDLYLYVPDADALHDHVVAAGGDIRRELEDAPYGLRDFELADPWDNRIVAGHDLPEFEVGKTTEY